ncbi:MAG TPA: PIN domain-containing protein [Thermoanaerobaculia bacterium]
MILLETSGLIAAIIESEQHHHRCAEVLANAEPPLILSPFVLAEADYLIHKYATVEDALNLLEDVARHSYELVVFTADEIGSARELMAKYRSLRIGLADASIAVLAAKYDFYDVLTLDERHFRAMRPAPRKSFRVLPRDA